MTERTLNYNTCNNIIFHLYNPRYNIIHMQLEN